MKYFDIRLDDYMDVDPIFYETEKENMEPYFDDYFKEIEPYMKKVSEITYKLYEKSFPLHCPKEGSFTGWKAGYLKGIQKSYRNLCLIQLEIPADAKRSSCYGNKCRCDKALVKSITGLFLSSRREDIFDNGHFSYRPYISVSPIDTHYEEAISVCNNDGNFVYYKVGEMVYPDSFDDNRWHECSHGIHFFMTKEEAIDFVRVHIYQ